MLYYLLAGLVFLSSFSQPLKSTDVSRLEPYFNQDEVLNFRINPEKFPSGISAPEKISESLGIHTSAKAAIIVDKKSGKILFQKESDLKLPIASISKLMTALVFLERNPDFDQIGRVEEEDNNLEGAKLYTKNGEEVKLADLFYSSLVGSANNATEALSRSAGLSLEEFAAEMNKKAALLGMNNTHFVEPTGLNEKNVSTAQDLVKLAKAAFGNAKIQEAATLKEYSFTTVSSQEHHRIKSQNKLLDSFIHLTGAKTGFTNEAGFSMLVQAKNEQGNEIIVAVLSAKSSEDRFQEVKSLVSWAFDNYRW